MRNIRTSLRILAATGLLAGLATLSAPAFAQNYDDDNITVTAPYEIRHHREFGSDSVSVSRGVKVADLDLRYDDDVARLQERISYTAEDVCRVAGDYLSDTSSISDRANDRECVRDAIREAQPQVRYAVRRARA